MLEQLAANGIIAGGGYVLLALSFGIIYWVTRTFHFAHGAVFVLGGYLFYQFADVWHLPAVLALPLVVTISALLGMAIEQFVYRPLRGVGSSGMGIMLSSLGLFVVLQNLFVVFWGGFTSLSKVGGETARQAISLGSIWITPLQVLTVVVSLLCWTALVWLLRSTSTGKAVRALAADLEMTELVGIKADRIRLIVYAIGSAIAGLGGILTIVDAGMLPTSGMSALLIAVITVIIGGVGSMSGAAVGALIIGMAQNLGIWKLPSEWQQAIAFAVLVVFIIWRPTGIFGRRRDALG